MRIDVLRRKFPEYGDITDGDLMDLCRQMLDDINEPEDKEPEQVVAVGVTEALTEVKSAVETASKTLTKIANKPEKEEKDLAPHFMALGMQLSKIEAGIQTMCDMMMKPKPKDEMAKPKAVKTFKIKRDELGDIDSITPVYED